MQSDDALLERARELAAQAGRPEPAGLEPLSGGRNNRLFRVTLRAGEPVVLKCYFSDARDTRDRLGAEWAFLHYARARGVRAVPEPLAHDRARRLGLYSLARGAPLAPGTVTAAHVGQAVDFVLAVNGPPREPLSLAPGSEACFSLDQHLTMVDARVARLSRIDRDGPGGTEAARFVADRLAPVWRGVRAAAAAAAARAGLALTEPLEPGEVVLSPSDFGFHNALAEDGRLTFLDFEYAGRDDPGKLVGDFFCQPTVPVPLERFGPTVDCLVEGLGLDARHRARCALLLDVYRVKWACIVLNPFLPVGAARRTFAEAAGNHGGAALLARAEAKLVEIARLG